MGSSFEWRGDKQRSLHMLSVCSIALRSVKMVPTFAMGELKTLTPSTCWKLVSRLQGATPQ